MAVITPGSGSTINALTIEGQLWQLIHHIQNGENISGEQRFNFAKDDTGILTGTFTIPAIFTRLANSTFADTAGIYQPGGIAFVPGTGGTIIATTLAQYFIDAVSYAVIWQNNKLKNPLGLSRISLSFSATALEYTGGITLPYSTVLGANGVVTESAIEWLTT